MKRYSLEEKECGTGHMVYWDKSMEEDADGEWVKFADLAAPAVANAATGELPPPMAGVRPHTELSRRLRDIICAEPFAKKLTVTPRELLAAANEIDRYYGGMMNWKSTAEAKDAAAIASLNKPVVAMTDDPKKGPIWEAIQRACGELPEGYEIRLHMENGYGGVEWSDPNGSVELIDGEGFISTDIEEAIDAALAAHAGQGAKA